ncbi:MAG: hypothetical protein LJE89_11500 [Deltaproteobacteria bacterium]|nr:hypothetical protein [Deltaproteobacteria bacterium]
MVKVNNPDSEGVGLNCPYHGNGNGQRKKLAKVATSHICALVLFEPAHHEQSDGFE